MWRVLWPELLLLLALGLLCVLPSASVFRWSFRWLPMFHLALALVAAEALQRAHVFKTGPGLLGNPGFWACALVLVTGLALPGAGGGVAADLPTGFT